MTQTMMAHPAVGRGDITIQPIDPARPDFAGKVSGIHIAAGISADEAATIEAGMDQYAVLVFHDQRVTDDQQYAFSKRFGPMETATGDLGMPKDRRLSMDINDISNLDKDGNILARDNRRRLFSLGNRLWHSDSSFKATPSKYSLLSARVIPGSGGNTEFADMRAAWDALHAATQEQCLDLVCDHSQMYSRALLGFRPEDFAGENQNRLNPVPQRLVRRHAASKRLSLYLASHAGTIHGWPVPEALAFLRDLIEHATQRQFVYAHEWRQFDLVMWDNRCTMHRARPFDPTQKRDMHRTTVADSAPTLQQPR
ncbi:MAG: TauD/TfdA dioxygenase family protein [Acetobacteraceae bacterium]